MKRFSSFFLISVILLSACGSAEHTRIDVPELDTDISDVRGSEDPYGLDEFTLGVIIPGDVERAKEISSFYQSITEVTDPSVVMLITESVSDSSVSPVQTCETCKFSTDFGSLFADEDLTRKMVTDGVAVASDTYFTEEDLVSFQSSFIKYHFPDASVIPVVVKDYASQEDLKNLSEWMDLELPQGALTVLSLDYSDFDLPTVKELHDLTTFTTIQNLDIDNIYDLDISSQAGLYAFLNFIKGRDYTRSSEVDGFFSFYIGGEEIEYEKSVSIMSFGNLPEEHTLDLTTSWRFDPSYDELNDRTTTKFLRDIRGQEDEFLVGVDFLVFDILGEGCRQEEQNGMNVAFCKFVVDLEGEAEFSEIIREETLEADTVYVALEYPSGGELDEDKKLFMRDLVKEGVDILVVKGLSTDMSFSEYHGSLIFYSLGDFIVDNKLAIDLSSDSEGMVLGLNITPEAYQIYLFPVQLENGYPKLKDLEDRNLAVSMFIKNSELPSGSETDLRKGLIKIAR